MFWDKNKEIAIIHYEAINLGKLKQFKEKFS